MLAAFTGYEVIAKVPVILHTPLMSGSNFVHGIVLVGAMVALGQAHTTLEKIIGFVGVFIGCGQRGRRLRGHRAHARDVQGQRRTPTGGSAGATDGVPCWVPKAGWLIQVSYLLTAFLFIMGLKRMSSPVTARSGIVWAGAGMVVATLVTFLYPGARPTIR